MNNHIFTPGELVTIRTNLYNIEKTLGHEIPGGLVDMSELKDYILSPGELLTVSHNLRYVTKKVDSVDYPNREKYRYSKEYSPSKREVKENIRGAKLNILFYGALIGGLLLLNEIIKFISYLSSML